MKSAHKQAAFTIAADALRNGFQVNARVSGRSMLPLLWPGMLVRIAPLSNETLKPGQIVCYTKQNRFIMHKFLAYTTDSKYVVCKGYFAKKCDEPVEMNNIIGKLHSIRLFGFWFSIAL